MHTLKVICFVLLIVGFYNFYANSIPQTESRPPKKISLDAKLTEDDMIEAGQVVYSTKGTCGICHGIGNVGSRGPDLDGIGLRAATMVPGMSAKSYLLESLLAPMAFLVKGYGPMMPPMANILTPGEVMVTVAYLQSLGGIVDITPDDVRAAMKESAAPAPQSVPDQTSSVATATVGDAEKGKAVYLPNCGACHNADPSLDGPVGPAINGSSRELLEARILSAGYPEGYTPKRDTKMMPPMVHLKNDIIHMAEFLK